MVCVLFNAGDGLYRYVSGLTGCAEPAQHRFSNAERADFESTIRSIAGDPAAAAGLLADTWGVLPDRAEHVVAELSTFIRRGADHDDRVLVMRILAAPGLPESVRQLPERHRVL